MILGWSVVKIFNAILCLNCLLTFRTFPLKIEIILCLKFFIPGIFFSLFQFMLHAMKTYEKLKFYIFWFFVSKSLIIRAFKNGSTWNDSRSKMMMSNRPLFDHKLAKLSLSNSRMIVHFTQYCKLPPCIIHSEQIRSKVFDFRFNDNQKVSSPSQKKTFEKVWFENEYYIDEHGDEKIKWSIASLGLFWQVQFKSISLLVIFC